MGKYAEEIVAIEESSVTARGYRHRTTIPSRVFQFLGLEDKDKLRWVVLQDGTVTVRRAGRK
jgi:bifunctional DNA-binding transcriptional regulator/antitoxin component of YhaV-PrlF toxin-antitoxin module